MTHTFYVVKDELTNRFLAPQFFNMEEEAKRWFKTQVNNIPLWKDNSSDYSLYKSATFDDETGTVIGITPEKIIGGRACVES